MAKIIITICKHPRGLHVDCMVQGEKDDTQGIQNIAAVVSAGLAGTVNEKIMKALRKDKSVLTKNKGKSHVH